MTLTNARGTSNTFTLTLDGAQVFTTTISGTTASFDWNTTTVADGAAHPVADRTRRPGGHRDRDADRHRQQRRHAAERHQRDLPDPVARGDRPGRHHGADHHRQHRGSQQPVRDLGGRRRPGPDRHRRHDDQLVLEHQHLRQWLAHDLRHRHRRHRPPRYRQRLRHRTELAASSPSRVRRRAPRSAAPGSWTCGSRGRAGPRTRSR